jgi:hypothetical protein
MKYKDGVVARFQPPMAAAIPLIDKAYADVWPDCEHEAVCTSAVDGKHMEGSFHAKGLALDLRTRDLHQTTVYSLAAGLRARLNGDEKLNRPYQVIIEADHIHVEYDPAGPPSAEHLNILGHPHVG